MNDVAQRMHVWMMNKLQEDRGALSVEWIGIVIILVLLTGLVAAGLSDADIGENIADVVNDYVEELRP